LGGCFCEEAVLHFVAPRLALHYFLLVFLGSLGVIQIAAAGYGLKRLSLIPAHWPSWYGRAAGQGILGGAFVWFVVSTPEMLRPGPAGLEIGLLFWGAFLMALLICRLGSSAHR